MGKTIRFQALVDRSGRPDVYTPWSDPLKDRAFQKARKENRVLTIHQNPHGAKDYGEVGFEQGHGSTFLIFPKSLRSAENKRVVGIHYDEIAAAKFPTTPAKPKKKPKLAAKETRPAVPSIEEEGDTEKSAVSDKHESPENENRESKETARRDPLTERLEAILADLEKKHVVKAKTALRKWVEEREGAGS